MHVPSLWEIAQDLQVPAHVVAQHAPCAQLPELHSALAPQLAPRGFPPQLPFRQEWPAVQSASDTQVVLHCPLVAHWNGAQARFTPPEQVPTPSHRPAVISVEPMHPAGVQIVPAEKTAQAPTPSHWPVRLHVVAPSSSQSSRGSEPRSATTHVPTRPGATHVRQTPEQSLSQQTPSEQKPVLHSLPEVQPWPAGTEPVSPGAPSRSPPISPRSAPASAPSVEMGTSAPPSAVRLSLL